ncbi:MAG: hypothetical protein ABIG44_16385 [Planctomycetota bacterium]
MKEYPRLLVVGDWVMAVIYFLVMWLVLTWITDLTLRKLGLTPSSMAGICLARAFPIVLSVSNVVLFLKRLIKKRCIELKNLLIEAGLLCKCGYDLTGNVSGVCPECGEKTTTGTEQ